MFCIPFCLCLSTWWSPDMLSSTVGSCSIYMLENKTFEILWCFAVIFLLSSDRLECTSLIGFKMAENGHEVSSKHKPLWAFMYSHDRSRAALNTLAQEGDSFFLFFPATSHPDDFPIKVKYRSSHARPRTLSFSVCVGFPRPLRFPHHQNTYTSQHFPPHGSDKSSSRATWAVRRMSAHENTICSQESGAPLVHGSFPTC